MCEVLDVSTSGYHEVEAGETERERWNRRLGERIRFHFYDNHGIFGSQESMIGL